MIYYDHLPLDKEILRALGELSINYVFQPIFYPDGKTVFAREALMRPEGKNVLDLINEYMEADRLHVLEVATIFGAMQAYTLRGYTERISVNSFPNDSLREDEAKAFWDYFGDGIRSSMIIENLEYPYFSYEVWQEKSKLVRAMDNLLAADDYGNGVNDMERIDLMKPDIVKLDRELISGIDHDLRKQNNVMHLVSEFHLKNILVVAEGVEEKEEFDHLAGLGVDFFQGFYLACPA